MQAMSHDPSTLHLRAPHTIIRAEVELPTSKSISNRLLLMEALSQGKVHCPNLSESEDTRVMKQALGSSGAHADIGHAGTAMRFLTAYYAITPGEHLLTGSERMKNRPIGKLVDALVQLGASIQYAEKNGYPPLLIQGQELPGSRVSIDGSTSSQYISALLMIAPLLPGGLELRLTGKLISASYIRLTLGLMKLAGIAHRWEGNCIHVPHQAYGDVTIEAEPDWSAASYWYELAALSEDAEILVKGLAPGSLQGDAAIEKMFLRLGVETNFIKEGALLKKTALRAAQFCQDFLETPDMVQTLAVSCVLMDVPFFMTGTQSLRIKETDRITALQKELAKFGARLEYSADGTLAWNGQKKKRSEKIIQVPSYQDHRMAMAFAPAVMKCGELKVEDPGVVEKSYPHFWDELKKTGISF